MGSLFATPFRDRKLKLQDVQEVRSNVELGSSEQKSQDLAFDQKLTSTVGSENVSPSLGKKMSSPSSSIIRKTFTSSLQSKLSTVLMSSEPTLLNSDRLHSFDMNDLPHMSNMRYILLFFCFLAFFVAPVIYMPLGTIQSAFYHKCFLFTEIKIMNSKVLLRDDVTNNTFFPTFDSLNTQWGPQIFCDFTTFVPVSVAIFSVIIGWSTFTIWPAMLSMGKGGVLMMVYVSMCIISLVAISTACTLLKVGYENTCSRSLSIQLGSYTVSCEGLETITISELSNKALVQDIHRSMRIAQLGAWCLVCLSSAKVLVSLYTFLIIWFHFHYAPFFMDDSDTIYVESIESL
ncbi:hypothetical protein BgiBS90_010787 [Biomphalaria glabrata]|nr:hypothetical protein BgiBS90_010787 [Biomphalaria glabrata]